MAGKSNRFPVAVHGLTLLGHEQGRALTSEDIAGSVNTNPMVISWMLGLLSKAGLVSTSEGAGGGTILARPVERVMLGDVRLNSNPLPRLPAPGGNVDPGDGVEIRGLNISKKLIDFLLGKKSCLRDPLPKALEGHSVNLAYRMIVSGGPLTRQSRDLHCYQADRPQFVAKADAQRRLETACAHHFKELQVSTLEKVGAWTVYPAK
jgi:hypothetical protein